MNFDQNISEFLIIGYTNCIIICIEGQNDSMTFVRTKEFIGQKHPVECFHFWFYISGFHEVNTCYVHLLKHKFTNILNALHINIILNFKFKNFFQDSPKELLSIAIEYENPENIRYYFLTNILFI